MSDLEQALADTRANESHTTSDQNIHAKKITGNRRTVEGIGWGE